MRSWMIGLVAGLGWVGFWPALPPSPALAVLVLAGALLAPVPARGARAASGLALGCAVGALHGMQLLESRLAQDCVGEPLRTVGVVDSLVSAVALREGSTRQRFTLEVEHIADPRCAGPARVDLSYYGDARILPGERWHLQVKLRRPWGLANPGSYNLQGWFARRRIDAVGYVPAGGEARRIGGAVPADARVHALRQSVSARVDALALPGRTAAVLRALSVADKGAVDPALRELFQRLGISHLLVISGLHVGLVAGLGYLLGAGIARAAGGRGGCVRWLPPLAGLAPAAAYAALAGFSLPTQRALYMLAAFCAARLWGRRSSGGNGLLLAAVAVLLANPLAPTGSGFWLSFGAVAALLWLGAWRGPRGRGRARGTGLLRLLATHAYMSLLMLPLGAWFFGGGSLVAALANLVMIPLIGTVVAPLGLLAAAAHLAGWAADAALWQLAAWPLSHALPLLDAVAAARGHWVYLPLAPPPAAVLLALLGALLVVLPLGGRGRLCAAALVLPLLCAPRQPPAGAPGTTHLAVLDVGQGTAVVVRAGDRALLYDTGGGFPGGPNAARSVVLPYLAHSGVRALDTFVVSHADLDHSAGTRDILDALPVGRLRTGRGVETGGRGAACRAGESWRWPGGQAFRILSPAGAAGLARNDSSCVLQVSAGGFGILLPGDIGAGRERELVAFWRGALAGDWLLAPHHGSNTSSSHALLKTARPRTAVVNAGYANRFGHPHPAVIARLGAHGVQVLHTAREGALEFVIDPAGGVRTSRHRRQVRRYWM